MTGTWDATLDPDDERAVDPDAELTLPGHLARPIEAPESDTVEQQIEVRLDDEREG